MGEFSSITRTGKHEPFNLHVARGYVQGHTPVFVYGYNAAVSSANETVWNGGGIYAYPTTSTPLNITATTATDVGVQVQINGLDRDFNTISAIVTVNGATTVTTSNSFYRVQNATVINSIQPTSNIVIKNTVPQTLGVVAAIDNKTMQFVYTVPAGYTLYIQRGSISTATEGTNQIVTARLRVRQPSETLFKTAAIVTLNNQFIPFDFETPVVVTEKCDVEATAIVSKSQDNAVSAHIEGILIKNESV